MSLKLPPTISSPSDLAALILDIHTYATWYGQFSNAQKIGVSFRESQPELSETTALLLRDWVASSPLSSTSLDELITELERISQHAPTITITLVAPAPAEVKKTLVAWCRHNLHPDMLVSLRFNATIIGGMVVRSRSHISDWSWKRSIMNNRHRFAEVLNRV